MVTNREFSSNTAASPPSTASFALAPIIPLTVRTFLSDRKDLNAGAGRARAPTSRSESKAGAFGTPSSTTTSRRNLGNDLSFIRRVDQKNWNGSVDYRWWPKGWIINWGPGVTYLNLHDFAGVLQNEERGGNVAFEFAKSITFTANVDRNMERYRNVEFDKTRFSFSGKVNTSRRILFSASLNHGDQIRFVANPFLGRTTGSSVSVTLRPSSRVQSAITLDTNRFLDVRTNTDAFDIKILRVVTTYQFTDRLLVRNILDRNTFDQTFGANLLLTYRMNAGTVFFLGYDDRHRRGDMINTTIFPTEDYQRTNRAVFTKLQYLFRNQ